MYHTSLLLSQASDGFLWLWHLQVSTGAPLLQYCVRVHALVCVYIEIAPVEALSHMCKGFYESYKEQYYSVHASTNIHYSRMHVDEICTYT